jgi:hypothetical protein
VADRPRAEHRIAVANFDAVEQTRTWLALGAADATRTMLGALRTALLLAETVVVDRNQVLEGIFFVAMGPDRMAWHLGLPPGAPLPLTVGLLAPGAGPSALGSDGPWRTAQGPVWGVPDDVATAIDLNYEAVAADRVRVSSPLVALTGDYDRSSGAGAHSVNAPRPSAAWRASDPEFLPPHVWHQLDRALARDLIEEGRRAWVTAMKTGRVRVEEWRRAPIDIGRALEASRVTDPAAVPLAEAIMRLEEPAGLTGACGVRHRWTDGADAGPCPLRHVTKRSLVVRWLDGEVVPELSPPSLEAGVHAAPDLAVRVAAFRWWVAAYYDAICARDDLRQLALHNVVPTVDDGTDPAIDPAIELAWGLRREPTAGWRVALGRLSRRRAGAGGALGVEGEIVEHLMAFSPGQYAQLQRYEIVDTDRLWTSPSNRAMFDLALAVRDIAGAYTSRATRLVIGLVRATALAALAVVFAFRDAGLLPVSGVVWIVTWVALAIVAAFPWAEVAALFRMSRGELQSTLRLRDQP